MKYGNRSHSVSSRIINAKQDSITNREYPWLAQVYRKEFLDKKKIKYNWYSSGGAIVTNTIIITCAKCVCRETYDVKKNKRIDVAKHVKDGWPNYYCTKNQVLDEKTGEYIHKIRNQNRWKENEVYYSIGTQPIRDPETSPTLPGSPLWGHENENVIVTIPNYDRPNMADHPDWLGRENKNGDIAFIRNKKGLGLETNQGSRISILYPTSVSAMDEEARRTNRKRLVHTAGRGRRYYSYGPKGERHTCYTNGATLNKFAEQRPVRCLEYKRRDDDRVSGCLQLNDVKHSFAGGEIRNGRDLDEEEDQRLDDLKMVSIKKTPGGEYTASTVHTDDEFAEQRIAANEECAELYNEALQAIDQRILDQPDIEGMLRKFPTKTDRFHVYKYESIPAPNPNGRPLTPRDRAPLDYAEETVCYIKNTVAKYGVCKTEEKPGWGFCSKSCQAAPLREKDREGYTVYEEIEAYFFEDLPEDPQGRTMNHRWMSAGKFDNHLRNELLNLVYK